MSEYGSLSSHARRDRDDFRSSGARSPTSSGNHGSVESDCILSLRNLAWSVTEDDLIQEFPRAINALIKLDDRNRSSGCGTVTFANSTDCRNAEAECADKEINGRSVRAKIGAFPDRPRDDGYRGRGGFGRGSGMGRDGDRPYYDRYNGGSGGGRRGGGDGMALRRFDDGGYSGGNDRRSYGNDGGYGGQRRGGFGGRGGGFGNRDGGGGFGGRDGVGNGGAGDRDRSPGRRRGGSGPRGGGAPRITSAVIRRVAGDSSDSDFDNRR